MWKSSKRFYGVLVWLFFFTLAVASQDGSMSLEEGLLQIEMHALNLSQNWEEREKELENLRELLNEKDLSLRTYETTILNLNQDIGSLNLSITNLEQIVIDKEKALTGWQESYLTIETQLTKSFQYQESLEKRLQIMRWGLYILEAIALGETTYLVIDNVFGD